MLSELEWSTRSEPRRSLEDRGYLGMSLTGSADISEISAVAPADDGSSLDDMSKSTADNNASPSTAPGSSSDLPVRLSIILNVGVAVTPACARITASGRVLDRR